MAANAEWDVKTIPDQTGKVALVTGAYEPGSLGYTVAEQLALKGATVYIHARTAEKAQVGIKALVADTPSLEGHLHPFVTELGNIEETYKAGVEFAKTQPRLDTLINSAGLSVKPYKKDQYGFSYIFTINHLSTFTLTKALLPLLKSTASKPGSDVRIVTVSSAAALMLNDDTFDFTTTDLFSATFGGEDEPGLFGSNGKRYMISKLANVLFTKSLQKQFDADKVAISALSIHPGVVATNGGTSFGKENNAESLLADALTPLQGALTPLWAATNPAVVAEKAKYGGSYLIPFGVLDPEQTSKHADDEKLAADLWATTDKEVTKILSQ